MKQKGQGAIEYSLIIVLLVIVAVIILAALGEHIANVFKTIEIELGITSFEPVTIEDVEAEEAAQAIEELGGYSSLPLTNDAQTHHQGQSWFAEKIASFYDNRGCTPHVDICDDYDIEIHWCDMGNKKAIALIIGHTIKQIVTGYMGGLSYWQSKCP